MLQILIFAECLIFTRVFNGWLYMEVDQKSDYNKNVFLIGLMGAGKTSVGRMLSRVLEKEFYDSDLVIEEKTGVKITDIFDWNGQKLELKDAKDIPDHALAAIKKIKITPTQSGDDIIEVELLDKVRMMQLLAKSAGLLDTEKDADKPAVVDIQMVMPEDKNGKK